MTLTVKQLNILRVYHKATENEIREGLSWYKDANDEAQRLATTYGVTTSLTAGVIAALSPGLRWDNNVEAAERVLAGEDLDGLGVRWYNNVRKAKLICDGHNPLETLGGNKVHAFMACILAPGNWTSVCIDGHAYGIWAGRRITLDKVPPINDRLYFRIAGDYVAAAKAVSIRPCQLQATVWVTWRRLHEVSK